MRHEQTADNYFSKKLYQSSNNNTSGFELFTPKQLNDLKSSGISGMDAKKCGIFCVRDKNKACELLNWKNPDLVPIPALVIPYYQNGDKSKAPLLFRVKADNPRMDKTSGKSIKYEHPKDKPYHIYFPPIINKKNLLDKGIPLFLTEGEKKAISMCINGYVCLAGAGVWQFHSQENSNGKRVLHEDFNKIPLKNREVVIVFDFLKFEKPNVLQAEIELAEMLHVRGAKVKFADLSVLTKEGCNV
jgi:hypothetical protein